MKTYLIGLLWILCSCNSHVNGEKIAKDVNVKRAQETLQCLYNNYAVDESGLLRETYPFRKSYSATYLAVQDNNRRRNEYSYLWPFSGTLSAVVALYEATGDKQYKTLLENTVLVGLEKYFDVKREPYAYASYINSASASDRFYDDNVWLGIDFTDLYMLTEEKKYLDKAELIWKFIESGTDHHLGGGIYWCEQKKESKNTCSNAPGAVFALKLFKATGDSTYFDQGRELYEWTKHNLQDTTDHLYFDNISLNSKISKAKYSYNSGQMMQAAALLYKLTADKQYLKHAQEIAESCYNYFFTIFEDDKSNTRFYHLRNGDNWFYAVMLRGFIELYNIDKNRKYLNDIQSSMDYAWEKIRDENGLFEDRRFSELSSGKETKWLLTQAAMVEMYARLSNINK